jgi:cell division septation protein DedD
MDSSAFIEPIDTASRSAASTPSTAAPSSFVTPVAVAPQRTSESSRFSVPTISSLTAGQYYVQLIAYNRPEQVESAVSNIGRAYPLLVQSAGTRESPIYRILIGPVNLGESGALLQRFKGLGYKDAFIRQGS